MADLNLSLGNMEKERDFYYEKLRDIEILCQRPELEYLPVSNCSGVITVFTLIDSILSNSIVVNVFFPRSELNGNADIFF